MAISSSSSWGKPRSWKLLTLTLLGLTLLVIVPLHQLGNQQSTGLYTRLTNYLGHESTSYDPADGFVADFKESDTASPILETDSRDNVESNDKTPEPADVVREPATDENNKDEADVQSEISAEKVEGESKDIHVAEEEKEEGEEVKPLADEDVLQVDVAEPERVTGNSVKAVDEAESAKELKQTETKLVEKTKPTESNPAEDQEESKPGQSTQTEKVKEADGRQSTENSKSEVSHSANGQKNDLRNDEGQGKGAGEDPEGGEDVQDGQNSQSGQNDQEDGDEDEVEGEAGQDSDDNGVEEPVEEPARKPAKSPACEGFPDTEGIMLVMKTGATEAFDKLPTHLLTDLQCMDDFLLFSDLVSNST